MKLADAHLHFFRTGYRRTGLPSMLGANELATYEALRPVHGIELALVIGYEAEGIDPANNAYVRELSGTRPWMKTLAFVDLDKPVEPAAPGRHLRAGHSGIALYAPGRRQAEALLALPSEFWLQLRNARAVVSLNARPEALAILAPLFALHADVRFLVSHLGLPGVFRQEPDAGEVAARLGALLALAPLDNVFVKISGLYALSEPHHLFPHVGARQLIAAVVSAFGPERCVWASDFAPALEFVSFAQTIDWPGNADLAEGARHLIYHDTLARLLQGVVAPA